MEQRDFEENLENLATLQRLELLLKFAATFCLVFSCVLEELQRDTIFRHSGASKGSAQRRNESEQKLVKIKGAIRNCLGFSDGVFSDQNSRKLDALRPGLAVAHKSAPISSDVDQGE
jgi:hypothetical protein